MTWIEVDPLKSNERNDLKRKQIVQTSPGIPTDQAKSDSFLGWQNQTVDVEVTGRRQQLGEHSSKNRRPFQNHKSLSTAAPAIPRISRFGIPLFSARTEGSDAVDTEWATPGVRPQDFIKGIKESDRTALNTREYIFYSYLQRIRDRLDRAWVPILRKKLLNYYRSGRHLASDIDHVTKVLVVLNENGEITRVQMIGESGTRDLDEAAVSAFNQAGPFPNPPKGMIDINHEIQIPWDFVLKT